MFFRKAILIIHGFGGGTYDQEDLANELEIIKKFDVYTFTLPGHQKNLSKVKYDEWIEKSETMLNKLIDKGYHSIYLIGHSMGGVIASYLTSKYPQVKKLVLAAPAFHYLGVQGDKFYIKDSIKDSSSLLKTYGGDEIISRFLKLNLSTLKEFTNLVKKYYDSPKFINCPLLIIHGDNDRLVPKSSVKYVYDNVLSNNKCLFHIKGLTHDLFKSDRDEEVFNLVKTFLLFGHKNGEFNI